ncbi:TonB-dependent copper receptor [Candidatus Regiella insecticola 5.15]|uniref:TonB-dependent copper receptor n=2 Tax=Candidatus Regiella insecticola TaxID=138073 RepID=G2GXN1_9ENTR|nr:TonB-dependent copper receptor [Candidatus Regiella insecticola 5.15]
MPSPNNLNQTTPLLRNTVTAIIVSMTMNLAAQSASAPTVEEKQKNQLNNANVIIVTAPQHSPLVVVSSLKTPRQPVPASDGSDYLKTIPGFSQIRNGGANGDPVFRGMFGSRLRILADGAETLGTCPSRMDPPTSYITPESYDVLTLIKGPQSVLWGPGASAGTILFERQPPIFDRAGAKGHISGLIGSNNRQDGNLAVSLGNQQGYLRLVGNRASADDYKDGNDVTVPSKWNKWNADIALGLTSLDQDMLLELTAGKGDGAARYAGRGRDGAQLQPDSLGLRFEKHNLSEVWDKVEAKIYYNYVNHIMDNTTLRSLPIGGEKSSTNLDRQTLGSRAMATGLWQDFKLIGGADWQTNTHRMKKNNHWKNNARFYNYGLFSELSWFATPQSRLITGARLDHNSVERYADNKQRSDNSPSGFIRFEHDVLDMPVLLYAGLGYSERFPDYWELFSYNAAKKAPSAFVSVKSEKTTQLDIGAQYNGVSTHAWVSSYLGQISDFILFKYDPKYARSIEINNVDATVFGGEMGIGYAFNAHWKAESSLAYSWGKNNRDQRPLPQIPPLEARFGLTYEQGNWSNTALWRVVSHQHRVAIDEGNAAGKDFSPSAGFAVLSANVAYRWDKQIKISAGIDNLLNKNYSEHLNLAGNGGFGYAAKTAINEPGRTAWIKLDVTF